MVGTTGPYVVYRHDGYTWRLGFMLEASNNHITVRDVHKHSTCMVAPRDTVTVPSQPFASHDLVDGDLLRCASIEGVLLATLLALHASPHSCLATGPTAGGLLWVVPPGLPNLPPRLPTLDCLLQSTPSTPVFHRQALVLLGERGSGKSRVFSRLLEYVVDATKGSTPREPSLGCMLEGSVQALSVLLGVERDGDITCPAVVTTSLHVERRETSEDRIRGGKLEVLLLNEPRMHGEWRFAAVALLVGLAEDNAWWERTGLSDDQCAAVRQKLMTTETEGPDERLSKGFAYAGLTSNCLEGLWRVALAVGYLTSLLIEERSDGAEARQGTLHASGWDLVGPILGVSPLRLRDCFPPGVSAKQYLDSVDAFCVGLYQRAVHGVVRAMNDALERVGTSTADVTSDGILELVLVDPPGPDTSSLVNGVPEFCINLIHDGLLHAVNAATLGHEMAFHESEGLPQRPDFPDSPAGRPDWVVCDMLEDCGSDEDWRNALTEAAPARCRLVTSETFVWRHNIGDIHYRLDQPFVQSTCRESDTLFSVVGGTTVPPVVTLAEPYSSSNSLCRMTKQFVQKLLGGAGGNHTVPTVTAVRCVRPHAQLAASVTMVEPNLLMEQLRYVGIEYMLHLTSEVGWPIRIPHQRFIQGVKGLVKVPDGEGAVSEAVDVVRKGLGIPTGDMVVGTTLVCMTVDALTALEVQRQDKFTRALTLLQSWLRTMLAQKKWGSTQGETPNSPRPGDLSPLQLFRASTSPTGKPLSTATQAAISRFSHGETRARQRVVEEEREELQPLRLQWRCLYTMALDQWHSTRLAKAKQRKTKEQGTASRASTPFSPTSGSESSAPNDMATSPSSASPTWSQASLTSLDPRKFQQVLQQEKTRRLQEIEQRKGKRKDVFKSALLRHAQLELSVGGGGETRQVKKDRPLVSKPTSPSCSDSGVLATTSMTEAVKREWRRQKVAARQQAMEEWKQQREYELEVGRLQETLLHKMQADVKRQVEVAKREELIEQHATKQRVEERVTRAQKTQEAKKLQAERQRKREEIAEKERERRAERIQWARVQKERDTLEMHRRKGEARDKAQRTREVLQLKELVRRTAGAGATMSDVTTVTFGKK